MSQKFVGRSFVSVAILAMVALPAMAQTPFAPPPQIPYGLSVSTESAKNAAAAQEASTWRSRKRGRQLCSGVRRKSSRTVSPPAERGFDYCVSPAPFRLMAVCR
jgi:hypothetical protein